MLLRCIGCKDDFELTDSEVEFYTTRKADDGSQMKIPKRCETCRRIKKQQKNEKHFNTDTYQDPPASHQDGYFIYGRDSERY
jgi:hypothetical protein